MQHRQASFPFSDLHSFKDYVGFVKLCAPDSFPHREGVSASDQWSLGLAFEGLKLGLELAAQGGAKASALAECQGLFSTAYEQYVAGNLKEGFGAMAAAQRVLRKLPSR
jgi:hypothetical protein